MFYSEKPIILGKEDLLGRAKVANELSREIKYYLIIEEKNHL